MKFDELSDFSSFFVVVSGLFLGFWIVLQRFRDGFHVVLGGVLFFYWGEKLAVK